MRYILVLILIFSSLYAEDEKQKVTIGLGPFVQTQPYKNVDDKLIASPVIFYDNGIAYVRWSRAGIYFYGDETDDFAYGFSVTIQPRIYGYESDDIFGMDERKSTWEGGLAFSAKTENAYIEIMALTDILDRYESWILKTEIGYEFELGKFLFVPSAIFVYQSSNFINYYYGVKNTETILSGFKEYRPSKGLQVGAQTYIKYPLTENFATLFNLRADRISNEAANSPLVDEKFIYSGLASLIYTFEY